MKNTKEQKAKSPTKNSVRFNKIYRTTHEIYEGFKTCVVCSFPVSNSSWDEGAGGCGEDIEYECPECRTLYRVVSAGFKLTKAS